MIVDLTQTQNNQIELDLLARILARSLLGLTMTSTDSLMHVDGLYMGT